MIAEQMLQGRHAIVTGGGSGIGAEIARELARLGTALTLMGRTRATLQSQAEALRDEFGSTVGVVRCDIGDHESVAGAFGEAKRQLGDAYILVNNAGQADGAEFTQMHRELWDRLLAVNLTGTMLCTQRVLPAMIEAGEGRVINIASTAGLKGYPRLAAYCAAKHGVIGLTRSLALETAKLGVTVNAVCPGYTDTDMAQHAVDALVEGMGITPDEALKMITRINPQRRMVRPEEVAATVAWLCSPDAAAVTGQAIAVAGGEVM